MGLDLRLLPRCNLCSGEHVLRPLDSYTDTNGSADSNLCSGEHVLRLT